MSITHALMGLVGALLGCGGCGDSRAVDQPAVCPAGPASIKITSPLDNEIVTTNSVQIEFMVEGFRLTEWSETCDKCENCGDVTVYGPTSGTCGSASRSVTSSPVTVIISTSRVGVECPIWTSPGPVSISLYLQSRYDLPPLAYDEVTIDFQPEFR